MSPPVSRHASRKPESKVKMKLIDPSVRIFASLLPRAWIAASSAAWAGVAGGTPVLYAAVYAAVRALNPLECVNRGSSRERRLQHARNMDCAASRPVLDLVAAARSVRDDERVGRRRADGGEEPQ